MGFCRRCGDIVSGVRCHCGGTPVAPVLSFKYPESTPKPQTEDRWSKTYVSSPSGSSNHSQEQANSGTKPQTYGTTSAASNPTTRKFPRPLSFSSGPVKSLHNMTDHITQATSISPRPPSPLKMSTTLSDLENDIIPSFLPHEPTLSKVYGSVLQPKDTLTMHSCGLCSTIFPPDATIYPNPSNSTSFLCKPCFTVSGGSKGFCPTCSRPVLALKAEGGFIHSGGKYWHKRCYNCAGCFKNIGDAPMVDLLGRPSCVECFDNCLKRDPTTPKKNKTTTSNISPNINDQGGLNTSYRRESRENSPAIEELEMRLGITKSREGSPIAETSRRTSGRVDTPLNRNLLDTGSPKSKRSEKSIPPTSRSFDLSLTIDNGSISSKGLQYTTLDLEEVKCSERPPKINGPINFINTTSAVSQGSFIPVTTSSVCWKCKKPILNHREGGQFVTIPGADENDAPHVYHTECFRCAVCYKPFNDAKKGQASFVKSEAGPCHTQCAPTEQFVSRNPVGIQNLRQPFLMGTSTSPPSRHNSSPAISSMPPPSLTMQEITQASPAKSTFPRFGGQNACPGCQKPVSVMEFGVVPGPQGTRWHASCLVCGGKKEPTRVALLGRVRDCKKLGEPGCGKKLDSAAKSDGDGGIWCRECLLLLGVGGSPQGSPIRSTLSPPFIGNSAKLSPHTMETFSKVTPQYTGSTTIARQFTNAGGSEAILRQLTGGGLSPTRSISPTKQLGMIGAGITRPRPKSVIGVRNSKSVDEGRGMYLVRQLTGATGGTL